MAHHQGPWEQEETGPAEAFLKYVGVAGVALTTLLAVGIIVGALVILLPTNESIGTIVFTGLLAVSVYAVSRYGQNDQS